MLPSEHIADSEIQVSYLQEAELVGLIKPDLVDKILDLQRVNKDLLNSHNNLLEEKKRLTSFYEKRIVFLNERIVQLLGRVEEFERYKNQFKNPSDFRLGQAFDINATWIDKIVFVLREAGRPLRSSEIVEILLKNDVTFRTITDKTRGLSTHLTRAVQSGIIIGSPQKGKKWYLYSLPALTKPTKSPRTDLVQHLNKS
jgi:hypothetical protein